jgi:hypothetical protein
MQTIDPDRRSESSSFPRWRSVTERSGGQLGYFADLPPAA